MMIGCSVVVWLVSVIVCVEGFVDVVVVIVCPQIVAGSCASEEGDHGGVGCVAVEVWADAPLGGLRLQRSPGHQSDLHPYT